MKKIDITFADLTHTGKTVDTNYFPLGIAYVASYAKKILGDAINITLFKYPDDLSKSLDESIPQVACFTNFSWNSQLSYEFAKQIKLKSPNTITVFGGPNYSNVYDIQKEFLREHPHIDFYVMEEGELSFSNLLSELLAVDLDIDEFVKKRPIMQGIHYYKNNTFVRNENPPRISDVSIIPSSILNGLMDKFIDDGLIPMVQTTRGCPYSCAFCHDGTRYQNKLKRFPKKRYEQEFEYLAQRTKVPYLCIPDLNFGIFKEDYETAKYIAQMQKKYNWPKYLNFTTAKSNKECVSRIVEFLGDSYTLGLSIQSTDKDVLKAIKRTNLPFGDLIQMAKKSTQRGGNSASEVILCLPGDSKKAHFKTIFDLIEAGIDEIRIYQFILLEGTEGGSVASKKKFEYQTRWRVLPRCFGHYQILGKKCSVSEVHEVCVGNNTMPHQDYLDCRKLDLIIEIFNNGKIFGELLGFLTSKGISRSRVFYEIYRRALIDKGIIGDILKEFELDERKNFFDTRKELKQFLQDPSVIDKYISGEYGANQIMRFRSEALVQHLEHSANMVFDIARSELKKSGAMNEKISLYLEELFEFILALKGCLLSADKVLQSEFHFDFVKLYSNNFVEDPLQYEVKEGIKIKMEHSDAQKDEINEILKVYGRTIDGFGHLIQRHYMFNFYRKPSYVENI